MTRKSLISFGINCGTLLLFFVTVQVMSLFTINKWIGVGVAGGIFIVSLILLLTIKRAAVRYVALSLNAVADGLAASSLFTYLKAFPEIWHTAVLFVALSALFFLYVLLTKIKFFQNHYVICMIIYLALMVAGGITAACVTRLPVFTLACLALIPFIAFFITTALVTIDDNEHIGKIAIASFAALALIIIIVVLIIGGGDGLDFSGDFGGAGRNKRNENPYDYTTLNMINR